METIAEIGKLSAAEFEIERALDRMHAEWRTLTMPLEPHGTTYVLSGVDHIFATLDEQLVKTYGALSGYLLTHLLTYLLTHSLTYLLTLKVLDARLTLHCLLTYLLTYSLTYLLTLKVLDARLTLHCSV